MNENDAELVALIDGELEPERKTRLMQAIAEDPALRARYEALAAVGAPMAAAFDALVDSAPVEKLRAAIPVRGAGRSPLRRAERRGWRGFAAGFVGGALAAGLAIWALVASGHLAPAEDWRDQVVEYVQLYTKDTFAFPDPDPTVAAVELRVVGDKVGLALTPEKLALPGLRFKVAFPLAIDSAPLAEIAFVDESGTPTLVCILGAAGGDKSIAVERRGDVAVASWTQGGRGYLVAGRVGETRVAEFARALAPRF